MCHVEKNPVSSTCDPRCTVFGTALNASAKFRSAGALYSGLVPNITSHFTLPVFMSATSEAMSLPGSAGTAWSDGV